VSVFLATDNIFYTFVYYTTWYNTIWYKIKNMTPFIFGSTVSKFAFTNRAKEIEQLKNNLLGGINTMIISPRRWGKSSLVEKVIHEIRQKKGQHKVVLIDLFSVNSEEEFLQTFAKEVIKASTTKWEDWAKAGKTFFKKLIPNISFGIDPMTDFSLKFEWEELQKSKDEVLNLPEIIAQQKQIQYIICLDEFQNLANYDRFTDLEKKMRAIWQRQKNVTYCLFGSKRHMMTEIFNDPSKPFFRFGDIMHLKKIERKEWIKFITQRFKSTGKLIHKDIAAQIATLMNDHSWYVQQLAHYTWNRTKEMATQQDLQSALEELIQASIPFYQSEVENLSNTQLNLLKAIAKKETQFTATKVMHTYNLGTPRNVSKNKTILIQKDMIEEQSGSFEFLDPAFELWFRNRFFNEPIKA